MKIIDAKLGDINAGCKHIMMWLSNNDFKVDAIVGVARGGLIPATILAYQLEVPMFVESVSSYDQIGNRTKTKILQPVNVKEMKELGYNNVLIVDDICDSGKTLSELRDKYSAGGVNTKTTTIYAKKSTAHMVSTVPFVVSEDIWVNFFWEGQDIS
jgi:hypoxanthine phosphoribosyltransferase|tara:strand:- start:299 stop:766 length:468 start_codon:yes stop_codon:yes gene_type:complete